jgi:hypothetical protein
MVSCTSFVNQPTAAEILTTHVGSRRALKILNLDEAVRPIVANQHDWGLNNPKEGEFTKDRDRPVLCR